MKRLNNIFRSFFQLESASGILLLVAAVMALVLANSRMAGTYEHALHVTHTVSLWGKSFAVSIRGFVDDGLMTLFFLLIGLELKLEWLKGKLSLNKELILPGAAALAGMLVPALVYVAVSSQHADALRGWAVPTATDIAFSLGVLSLLGKRVPATLVFFLMLLAILDDAGAVLVIGLFYSSKGSLVMLALATVLMTVLVGMGRCRVTSLLAWCLGGGLLWYCLAQAGVHPVLSGVLVAIAMPGKGERHWLDGLVTRLHPGVAFGIMPLFALVNAGVSLRGGMVMPATMPIVLAIMGGLFIGKPLGILGVSSLLVRLRVSRLPKGVNWRMFSGVAFLCGIGFTMSLFIGTLAFENQNPVYAVAVRQGVLLGSLLSGMVGAVILYFSCQAKAGS